MRDAAPPAPATISTAHVLWIVVVALGVVGAVVLMLFGGPTRVSTSGGTLASPRGADIAGGVFAVVLALVQLAIARSMRDGRRWARTALLVLTILQVLGTLSGASGGGVLTWASVACAAVACLLMLLPPSTAFFERHGR
jgi:hypothetical protein